MSDYVKENELLPCPFCGLDLSSKNIPQIMTVRPVHSEEYLIAKLNKGHFLGSDIIIIMFNACSVGQLVEEELRLRRQ